MGSSREDEALARYQRTWRWTALIPSSAALLFWTYLFFTCGIEGTRAETVQRALHARLSDDSMELAVWMAAATLHLLFVLSPMLAWSRVRTAMRQTASPHARTAPGSYRAAARADRSWPVSGPSPRWVVTMFFVGVIINASSGLSRLVGPYNVFSFVGGWATALAQVCFCYAWWRRCRRDAARVGVIAEATKPDGSPGLVLLTAREVQRVTIAEYDRASRRLRLFGSPEIWHAVDPIDDLVSIDDAHTRQLDGRGEGASPCPRPQPRGTTRSSLPTRNDPADLPVGVVVVSSTVIVGGKSDNRDVLES
jgi:hypothetical protein